MTDGMSFIGARLLARNIENHWKYRGYKVVTRVDKRTQRTSQTERDGPVVRNDYDVRSDMINGLPRAMFGEQSDV